MFSMPTDPEFYFALGCAKLGKTIELEPSKSLSITEHNEFVLIGKLKSPVSKVSFCYLIVPKLRLAPLALEALYANVKAKIIVMINY